jgi:hypothetical protein
VVVADGGADDFVQSQRVGPLDLVSEGVEPENMAAVRELLVLFALGSFGRLGDQRGGLGLLGVGILGAGAGRDQRCGRGPH